MRDIPIDQIKKDIDVQFDSCELVDLDGNFYAIFNNLILKTNHNKVDNKIIIKGNVFPIFFSNKYFHMLLDNVALAEYSKSIIDNLNIQFFIMQYPIHEDLGSGQINEDPATFFNYLKNKAFNSMYFLYDDKNNFQYFEDIANFYKNEKFIYEQLIYTELEKCFLFIGDDKDLLRLFNQDKNSFVRYYFGEGTRDYAKGYTDKKWIKSGIELFKNNLNKKIKVENKDKKIYISRKQVNKLYSSEDFKNNKNQIVANESLIESLFINSGFESVSLEGMSFTEQYILFNESSDIAGYNGTNLLNTILCQNQVNIYEVVPDNKEGYFDYFMFSKLFKNNHQFLYEKEILSSMEIKLNDFI